jgi:hypothetical protein
MPEWLEEILGAVSRAAWAPVVVFGSHAVLGRLFGHEPYVDPAMHFAGGMAIAYFLRVACRMSGHSIGKLTELGCDLTAFSMACAAAVFWEIGEFLSDHFFGTRAQISNANTMRDLIIGVVGASFFLILRRLREFGRR